MDNQSKPVQPMQTIQNTPVQQSEFLNKMDTIHGTNVEPPKKGLGKGAIIGIIIGVLVLIGGIVAAVILMNQKPEKKTTPTNPIVTPTDPEDELDEEAKARNLLRANDLVAFGLATNTFQANNKGQIPGTDIKSWEWIISNYVEGGKLLDGATGEPYKIAGACKFGESCVDVSSLTWENNHNEIYILLNADCKGKTKSDVTVSSTAKRRVAMFAIIEGDTFICATNN